MVSFISFTSAFPISIRSLRIVVVLSVHVLDGGDRLDLIQAILWHFVREPTQTYLNVLRAAHGMCRDLTFFPERTGWFTVLFQLDLPQATQSPGFNRLNSLCVIFRGSFVMLHRQIRGANSFHAQEPAMRIWDNNQIALLQE